MLALRLARALVAAALVAAMLVAPATNGAAEEQPIPPEEWVIEQSALCSSAIREAEQRHRLPSGLLDAIARAESGRPVTAMNDIRAWPWTIDADGEGLFLDGKAAAVAWVQQQRPRHRYIDVGCLQVDLTLHPKAFASLQEAFDPTANADYAARFLSDLYHSEAGGNWNVAVGLYHSHTAILAGAYRDRVAMVGERILHGVARTGAALCARHQAGYTSHTAELRQIDADQREPTTRFTLAPQALALSDRADFGSVSQWFGEQYTVHAVGPGVRTLSDSGQCTAHEGGIDAQQQTHRST